MNPFTERVTSLLPNQVHKKAIEVDAHLRVKGAPLGSMYAIGDCATVRRAFYLECAACSESWPADRDFYCQLFHGTRGGCRSRQEREDRLRRVGDHGYSAAAAFLRAILILRPVSRIKQRIPMAEDHVGKVGLGDLVAWFLWLDTLSRLGNCSSCTIQTRTTACP